MSYLQIFKRIIPFFLTFAAGLLIASIFVPIGALKFPKADRGGKGRFHRELRQENEALRRENDRLRQENEQLRSNVDADFSTLEYQVPEIRIEAPAPPPPPRHRVK
jgi:cell division protein FtsB